MMAVVSRGAPRIASVLAVVLGCAGGAVTVAAQAQGVTAEREGGAADAPSSAAPSPAAGASVTAAIGVVDVPRALEAFPRMRQMIDELKGATAEVKAELDKLEQERQTLKITRDGFDFLTPEWIRANASLEASGAALEARRVAETKRVESERERIVVECEQILNRAVAELANKRGLLLVLRALRPPADDASDHPGRSSDVLHYAPALDLTDDVIKLLKSPAYSGSSSGAPAHGSNGSNGKE
jgi:Skp family chaperone for outer membrane proteins